MTRDAQVAVVGGGVMGAATAWQLARRGVDVVLVERFGRGHVFGASHGASRNFNVSYEDPALLAWLREASVLWRELEAETGAGILTTTGIVNHGPGRDLVAAGRAIAAGGFETELLDAAEASARWPGFRFAGPVLHTPQAGRLHADRARAGFADAAAARGARVLTETAVVGGSVGSVDDGVALRLRAADGAEQELRVDRVVVTAGAWTVDVLASLGATFALPPLRVTQEQPAFFAPLAGAEALEDWPGFNHSSSPDDPATAWFPSGVYGMGSPGEGVKAGWHGVGPETHPDRRTFVADPGLSARIRRYAQEWLPGVDAASLAEITCTYTSTPDSAFFLERVGPVTVGAGFSGQGFKFAPTIGRVLADLITAR
ncbi:FAD-dependent oxidoreductase [Microbacterium sp. SS28]|uniref:FAD-dependent oxidoreductase n=1 Tax=Microbacterium sp. SS28 TaxID=2919948 RepID=UPI001FAB24B7|nr:FAD-dependent oxidoreductase [Microbacterium sp. SS28]